jgi:hypothetical protein
LKIDNYSKNLLEQDGRREYMTQFLNTFEQRIPLAIAQVDVLSRTPLSRPVSLLLTKTQKKNHFSQVVPIEEVEQIFKMVEGVIRLPCVCRKVTTGNKNAR